MIGLLLSFLQLYSWDLSGIVGGRSNSMGNCSVALSDFWSIANNPAGIAGAQHVMAGFAYDNRFFMKELSNYAAAFVIPSSTGALGLSFNRFGFNNYNENKIGLAYSRCFGEKLRIGLKLDYLLFRFSDDYSARQCATIELGFQTPISESVSVGVYLFNPIFARTWKTKTRIPIIIRCGFSYKITKDFIAFGEIEYDTDKKTDYRLGFEYHEGILPACRNIHPPGNRLLRSRLFIPQVHHRHIFKAEPIYRGVVPKQLHLCNPFLTS